ncbi:hypothetical protein BDQ94DRAFT_154789 [Aspergillus welwitschiae]|uniref:Uncharacterized protein n=1 Tax=Aspergillus welwitschiae TaxID=1341132 RepID=A0A3F3PIL4_9EURO|nr:hypothetical protein BDQ94DRAFT_154983 [Aspergillus welwitschiae]XP_026619959.1 hypothetical protein BDQ94DRAFT_154789 [Aspergillus welwitschiae]RDH26781.1 hypothetical protein BDQ94DRAFT_154983 [Aspergillus welwitschiae]RDH26937.1 hypothetical protein BDQ94DRAFT_154789 [Aspergillus welwitschiae]
MPPEPCRPKRTRLLGLRRDDLELATIALGPHRTPTRFHAIAIERKLSCVLDLYPSQ